MNIETREVHWWSPEEQKTLTEELKAFGWQYTQDTQHGRSLYHIFARDMDMPNYKLIKALDDKYFSLKKQLKVYNKPDFSTYLLLFVLFIIPWVLFFTFKMMQKQAIADYNADIRKQMDSVVAEAKPLLPQKN